MPSGGYHFLPTQSDELFIRPESRGCKTRKRAISIPIFEISNPIGILKWDHGAEKRRKKTISARFSRWDQKMQTGGKRARITGIVIYLFHVKDESKHEEYTFKM